MRQTRRRTWVLALLALVAAGCGYLGGDDDPQGWPDVDFGVPVEVYRDTDTRPLHVHLFQPDPAPTQPAGAVLFFHGGGFTTTRLHQFEPQATAVAAAGMVGIIVEYRVSGDGVDRDHSIDDGRAAVAWIRTNADRLGIDPNRIALAGASAGGYLVTNADADPDAYVLFNPAVSAQIAARSEDAPTIVFHSRADTIVDFADAENYCNAEPDCQLVAYDTGDHGFFNNGDAYTDTLNHTIKFLTTHGW